jgi:hypothetical protein
MDMVAIAFFIFMAIILSLYFVLLFKLNRKKYSGGVDSTHHNSHKQRASDKSHWTYPLRWRRK